jgi:hypothetical protein
MMNRLNTRFTGDKAMKRSVLTLETSQYGGGNIMKTLSYLLLSLFVAGTAFSAGTSTTNQAEIYSSGSPW